MKPILLDSERDDQSEEPAQTPDDSQPMMLLFAQCRRDDKHPSGMPNSVYVVDKVRGIWKFDIAGKAG